MGCSMKASDYIASYVASLGIRHVFTLAGGGSMHLNDSFGHYECITPIYMLHESGAAIAAEAYAKASERMGVCVVTAGPGVTNALTGCAAAWLESTPVLFISGDSKLADLDRRSAYKLRQGAQQDVPTIELVKPITKLALEAGSAKEIPELLEELTKVALGGRPGPVWLSAPLDIQAQDTGDDEIIVPTVPRPVLYPNEIIEITRALESSYRPLLLLGAGIGIAHARNEIMTLIDYLGVPVLTTWPASDLIPFDHPLFVGRPGPVGLRAANKVLQEADLLISIGARLDPATCCFDVGNFGANAVKIQVDIDQGELDKNDDGVDYILRADAGYFICAMMKQAKPHYLQEWVEHCQEVKAKYPFEALGDSPSYALTNILNEITTPSDIFANGVASYACNIFSVGWKPKAGQRAYAQHALGSMGCDIPNAIGACLGSGGRRTICVTGDGSFMQNMQELEVVRRLRLPIVFFVANNGGYGCIERSQGKTFRRVSGAELISGLTLPGVSKVAGAMEIQSVCARDELHHNVIRYALTGRDPCVVEYVAYNEPELPHVTTTIGADGIPHSNPIDRMWPDE